jgi:hypothetical protein
MAHQTVRWCTRQGIVHYPVPATSADRWGLKRLTIEVLCPLAAPDSPVAHQTCPVRTDFAALTSDFCTVHFYCSHSRPLSTGDRYSIGTPDMSGAHRTVRWIITSVSRENPRAASWWGARPGHQTVSGAPLASPFLVFSPIIVESPTQFLSWFMLNLMHLR